VFFNQQKGLEVLFFFSKEMYNTVCAKEVKVHHNSNNNNSIREQKEEHDFFFLNIHITINLIFLLTK
jgi:hypothetical protein